MPVYFFHVLDDVGARDEEGMDLPDMDAAREIALDAARDLVCEQVRKGYLNLDYRIEVEDADGAPVLTLTFRDAFQIV